MTNEKAVERITPPGSDQPFPPFPDTVEYTGRDRQRAVARWDTAMPGRYRGLLEAPAV